MIVSRCMCTAICWNRHGGAHSRTARFVADPCRLVRPVKEIPWLDLNRQSRQTSAGSPGRGLVEFNRIESSHGMSLPDVRRDHTMWQGALRDFAGTSPLPFD